MGEIVLFPILNQWFLVITETTLTLGRKKVIFQIFLVFS